jgi:hypothetical protein
VTTAKVMRYGSRPYFEQLIKSAGALDWQSGNNVLMASMYPWIVADQEL